MRNDNRLQTVIKTLRAEAAARGPGARLPSVRELVDRLSASPVTIARALAELVRDGAVVTRPGHGTFVAEARSEARAGDLGWQAVALGHPGVRGDALLDLVDLPNPGAGVLLASSGYPDAELHPTALLAAAMGRAARRPGIWDRAPTDGLPELRAWFARIIGGGTAAHELLVTSGGQAALASVFRALVAPGDAVLVEAPTYVGAILAARAAGAQVVPVAVDGDGIRPELLARALEATRARVVCWQPTYANPHGAVAPPARRAEVLAVVRAAGAFLVEDDWARHLPLDGPPPPPLFAADPDGHVVYVGSLTKCVAPSFRIGAVAARGAAAVRLRTARVVDELFLSGPLQAAALELVSSPAWGRHLRRLADGLRARRDALVALVRAQLPGARLTRVPGGGLHLWVELPPGTDDLALARAALREGVVVSPGAPWFAGEPPGPFLRLSFGGAPAPVLAAAVATLARLLGAQDVETRAPHQRRGRAAKPT